MPDKLNGRSYLPVKTGIEDLEKLREVQQKLIRQDGVDRLKQRARIRREFATPPLSRPTVPPAPQSPITANNPYRVSHYDPDSDRWLVSSVSNPSDQFLAYSLKAGGIETGAIVRGYPPYAIEPKSQGRRFKPVEEPITRKKQEITITINIGYTGKL